jgi:uncharacterized protein (DUF2132 family)
MALARRMRRAAARKNGTDWPVRTRPHRLEKRGNAYSTLHPTNGWQRISDKRLRAQARLAHMVEVIEARKSYRRAA